MLIAAMAMLLPATGAHAQIFRCSGGTYTNNAEEARKQGCKLISDGKVQATPSPPAKPRPPAPAPRASLRGGHAIEVSHNDELFIINGEKYEAKVYCFNMEAGDQVLFLDGSPYGACVSATLLNLRTRQKCEVWCE